MSKSIIYKNIITNSLNILINGAYLQIVHSMSHVPKRADVYNIICIRGFIRVRRGKVIKILCQYGDQSFMVGLEKKQLRLKSQTSADLEGIQGVRSNPLPAPR